MATLWVGSRKGLFRFDRAAAGWQQVGKPAFLAAPVTFVLDDPREALARAAALWFGAQPAVMVAVNRPQLYGVPTVSTSSGAGMTLVFEPETEKVVAEVAVSVQICWALKASVPTVTLSTPFPVPLNSWSSTVLCVYPGCQMVCSRPLRSL